MNNNEVIIKILTKLDKMYGDSISIIRCRKALEEILDDYNITPRGNEIMIINNMYEMIGYYLITKKSEGLSENSIESYERYLKIFSDSIMKDVIDINELDIRVFLANYSKKGVCNTTISTITDILRGFFNWLEASEYIKRNPIKLIKNIKTEKNLREPLSKEDIEILRNGCKTLRQKSIVEVFYATGCRVSEVENMKISDINWENKYIKVKGKGNKERLVYLDAPAYVSLKNYLNSRNDNYDYLFLTERSPYENIKVGAIQREIKKITKQSGLNKNVFCHKIRTTTATHLINSGASITNIQRLLGHKSSETTLRYAQISDKTVEQEYRKYR